MREMSIGELARRTGTTPSALRYYDQRGLLGAVARSGGKRRFAPSAVRRVNLVRAAAEAGFSLAEIGTLLDERPDTSTREQWELLASRRLPELDALIERLVTLRETVASCLSCGCLSLANCALLHSGSATGSAAGSAGGSAGRSAPGSTGGYAAGHGPETRPGRPPGRVPR